MTYDAFLEISLYRELHDFLDQAAKQQNLYSRADAARGFVTRLEQANLVHGVIVEIHRSLTVLGRGKSVDPALLAHHANAIKTAHPTAFGMRGAS